MIKKVTIYLNPIAVDVDVNEGMENKDILEKAKPIFLNKLQDAFPGCKYVVRDQNALSMYEAYTGQVVKEIKTGEIGVIIRTSQKTIIVASPTGIKNNSAENYFPINQENIEGYMWQRPSWRIESNIWNKGDVGFCVIKDKDKGVITVPVVISNIHNNKYTLHVINTHFRCKLEDTYVKRFMSDIKKKANIK